MKQILAKTRAVDWLVGGILLIVAGLICLELFVSPGRPITYDGSIHLANIGAFSEAIKEGQWPATWANGLANFGSPTLLIVQQVPFYIGGLLNLITGNVITTFNVLCVLALFLSAWLFYWFLIIYFPRRTAFVASLLLMIAPYRLLNIYSRGALPELMATIFLPLLLISLYLLIKKKWWRLGWSAVCLSVAGTILSHPFVAVQFLLAAGIYVLFLLVNEWRVVGGWQKFGQKEKLVLIALLSAGMVGIMLASYYLAPLLLETKYLLKGAEEIGYMENSYLNLREIWGWKWGFWDVKTDFGPRPHTLKVGFAEGLILIGGILTAVGELIKRKDKKKMSLTWHGLIWTLVVSGMVLFLLSKGAVPLFTKLPILSQIQHQWRFLSLMMFLPPLVLALSMQIWNKNLSGKSQKVVLGVVGLVVLISCLYSFNQTYGKNYLTYDQQHYYVNRFNLHNNHMETIWSGGSGAMPLRKQQWKIIEGNGEIIATEMSGTKRKLKVVGDEPLRLIDYTYYFPGWTILVDGQEVAFEFQDPEYRGLITYWVPAGESEVVIEYKDTKVRLMGKVGSGIGLVSGGVWVGFLAPQVKKWDKRTNGKTKKKAKEQKG